jgi:sphingomyelin phosphodiesterase
LPEAFNTPNSIRSDNGSNALSWNYQLLSSLWQQYGWINNASAQYAATHYGAYSTVTKQGLKIISINTDFWYVDNIFNFYSFTNPDVSGILTFLISELTASEAANQRVWIIGHVLSGYDGSNALPNPSALFYSIVRRFSPATIAGVFFGHTHEDQLMIYYDYAASSIGQSDLIRNTTDVDYNSPLAVGFIGPSITPLTGNNAGWQLYTVDAQTFEVLEIHTYFANVSNANTWTTPVWEFEYSARAVYDPHNTWPKTSPLNGTFWNGVTKNMLQNQTLVEQYNLLETKSSALTKNCSSAACAQQKVCYIRSGSAALGNACSQGNGPS